MKSFPATALPTLLLMALTSLGTSHADWTSFRNGGSSEADMTLPTQWSEVNGIAWQTETQGYGQSCPVVMEDSIFLTSVVGSMCEQCLIECRDVDTGELRWSYHHDSTHPHPSNYMNARAASTPVVDDHRLYCFFETGDLVAVDLKGKLRWSRDLTQKTGPLNNSHGVGSSLTQDEERIFLNLEHNGPSFLFAIDKKTGESVWTADRQPTQSWSSPIVVSVNNQQQVIVSSNASVVAYMPENGKRMWEIDGMDGNSIPSPTPAGQRLLIGARLPEFSSEGSFQSNCCLDFSSIDNDAPRVAWRANKAICEYASPVVADDFAYFLNKANVLHCLDVQSGTTVYRQRIDGTCWATPIVAGDLVYFFCKNGECHVVRSGEKFDRISKNRLWPADNPPKPEHYVESTQAHAHSHGHAHSSASRHDTHSPPSGHHAESPSHASQHASESDAPGQSMIARFMAHDQNGNGILEKDELPAMFQRSMSRTDLDHDGMLNAEEMEAMAKSFAERRKNAQAGARDPIVYGVAASNGQIFVRTGTRLYAIRDSGPNIE